jgi:hypothetical protein
MIKLINKEQFRAQVIEYYALLKKALQFQQMGNITEYTRSMIRAQQIADKLQVQAA